MPKLTDYQPIWRPGYQPTQDLKYNLFVNRLKLILPTIDEDKNKKIIDIGCNIGWNCFVLNELGYNVTGIDINKDNIKIATDTIKNYKLDPNSISFFSKDIVRFLKKNSVYYDYCICFMLLHHFFDNRIEVRDEQIPFTLKPSGIELLKLLKSKCKSLFLQVRLHIPDKKLSNNYEDNQLVDCLINQIGFKSYKVLRSKLDYFRAPNLLYMFNN